MLAKGIAGDEGPLAAILSEAAKTAGGELGKLAKDLEMRRSERRKLGESNTVFDACAVYWGLFLDSSNANDLAEAFGQPAKRARANFGYRLARDALVDGRYARTHLALGRQDLHAVWQSDLADDIAQLLHDAVLEERGVQGSDDPLKAFVGRFVAELPAKLEAFYLDLPGVREKLTLAEVERSGRKVDATYGLVSGDAYAEAGLVKLRRYVAQLISERTKDVFGRDHRQAMLDDQPGFMALADVYVEPQCIAPGSDHAELVRPAVKRHWDAHPDRVVLLSAAFGMGKSLTTKMLAADIGEAWLQIGGVCPLFLHAPDLFRGRRRTIEDAILRHLENGAELSRREAEAVWERLPFTVLIDSFDEIVLQSGAKKEWLEEIEELATHTHRRVLLASRPYGYESEWVQHADILKLQPFDRDQIVDWLARTKGPVHEGDFDVDDIFERLGDELATTPILLLMAAWVWDDEKVTKNKTTLYQAFIDRISRGKWEGVQADHPAVSSGVDLLEREVGQGAFQEALALIAWMQMEKLDGKEEDTADRLSVDEIRRALEDKFITKAGKPLPASDARTVTNSLVLSLFIRPAQDQKCIRFSHKSFREFLCARHMLYALQRCKDESPASPLRQLLARALIGLEECQHFARLCIASGWRDAALIQSDAAMLDYNEIVFEADDRLSAQTVEGTTVLSILMTGRRDNSRMNGALVGAYLREYTEPALSEAQSFIRMLAPGVAASGRHGAWGYRVYIVESGRRGWRGRTSEPPIGLPDGFKARMLTDYGNVYFELGAESLSLFTGSRFRGKFDLVYAIDLSRRWHELDVSGCGGSRAPYVWLRQRGLWVPIEWHGVGDLRLQRGPTALRYALLEQLLHWDFRSHVEEIAQRWTRRICSLAALALNEDWTELIADLETWIEAAASFE